MQGGFNWGLPFIEVVNVVQKGALRTILKEELSSGHCLAASSGRVALAGCPRADYY